MEDKIDIFGKHSDIIYDAPNRIPKQTVINLEVFLKRTFPDSNLFTRDFDLTVIRNSLQNTYGNYENCFQECGRRIDIECERLKYFQPDVGISGPKHSKSEDPVHVVKYKGEDILFNGYHRTFYNLLNGQRTIKAYCLTI